ncbi:MAG: hypothetical protein LBO79_02680 [Zoogloeaceae bacterium]|nr:hypothetical protein [Zoogloeaceae bacterium]
MPEHPPAAAYLCAHLRTAATTPEQFRPGFLNYPFWQRAATRGAKLLFRAKANQRLPRETECADGSYLTTLYANDKDRRHRVRLPTCLCRFISRGNEVGTELVPLQREPEGKPGTKTAKNK